MPGNGLPIRQRANRFVVAMIFLNCLCPSVWSQDVPPERGRIEGAIVDVQSGKPVSGAKVSVMQTHHRPGFGPSPKYESVTGDDGRYAIEIPFGHYHQVEVEAPAGYRTAPAPDVNSVVYEPSGVTSRENPVKVVDCKLEPGTIWKLKLEDLPPTAEPTKLTGNIWESEGRGYSKIPFQADHTALLTLPVEQGDFMFQIEDRTGQIPGIFANLTVEPMNGMTQVKSFQMSIGFATTDPEQHPPQSYAGTASSRDHELTIQLSGDQTFPTRTAHGQVVDADGKAIAGAAVRIWVAMEGSTGRALTEMHSKTAEDGTFQFSRLPGDRSTSYLFEALAGGYSSRQSPLFTPKDSESSSIDVGVIPLQKGHW